MNMKSNTKKMTQLALLVAIEIIIAFTPLGSIPIPFSPIVATIGHIPPIIAGIVLGPAAGAFMGLVFGLCSFCVFTFMPPGPVAFVFTPFYTIGDVSGNFFSLLICFVPRILTGYFAAISFKFFTAKKRAGLAWHYFLSGIIGSLTNTILVLGGIYLFFGEQYASIIGAAYSALLGLIMATILSNGVAEAILAAILAYAIGKPLIKYVNRS